MVPPNLTRRVRAQTAELPFYAVEKGHVTLVPPPPLRPTEVEPSPLLSAIVEYLERR